MPGSGKTFWARRLAAALGYNVVDLDAYIVAQYQKSIPQLFAISEQHFRNLEHEALSQIITHRNDTVISTGGGAPIYHNNMDLMKQNGCVIYLEVAIAALKANIKRRPESRPMLAKLDDNALQEKLEQLYLERKEIYQKAHLKVQADNISRTTFAGLVKTYISQLNRS